MNHMNLRWRDVIAALALIAITIWFIHDDLVDNHGGAIAISIVGAFAAGFLLGAQYTVRKPYADR
jgi:hypothetical protein